MTKNRRPTSGGYTRGHDTRARVVASAVKLFGQHGFAGTTTRDIAVHASVNAPALQYYFASKEGLYLACVEYMVAQFWSYVAEAAAKADALLTARAKPAQLIDAYCVIQERLADFMFSSQEPADWLLIIAREQAGQEPDAGFQLRHKEVNLRLLRVNSAIVARLLGIPATSDESRLRAMTLSGQLLVFLFMRRNLLTALAWDSVDENRVSIIKRLVRGNTEALLNAMIAARRRAPAKRRAKSSPSATRMSRRPARTR